MKYTWPLNDNNFTFLDRLKIAKFFLNPNQRWTQGEIVKEYEKAWAQFIGVKYALMTSSGSTANALVAQYVKDKIATRRKKIIVLPAVTWATSVNPWIREGFKPSFIDVNLENYSMDLNKLEICLKENHGKVACVFATSLLGFNPDIKRLKAICDFFKVTLKLDNCENSFSQFYNKEKNIFFNISSEVTSTTSNYFGHQTTNGGESGFIFTNNKEEYLYYLMARNHGMIRGLKDYGEIEEHNKVKNKSVNEMFDFNLIGNNYRNTNIGAFMGLLDFKRINSYISKRLKLYNEFQLNLPDSFILPSSDAMDYNIPFCLPLIINPSYKKNKAALMSKLKKILEKQEIEYRPIIGGNLLRQSCYKEFGNYRKYPKAEHLHKNGIYIGLYPKLKVEQIHNLTDELQY